MHKALKSLFLKSLPLATLGFIATITNAKAQITPDDSLGAESSTVTPETRDGIPSDLIEGGAARGANLFHSFKDFNIGEGSAAYFANPEGIANILSRVTGGNASSILGKLGVLGNANLFLINPAGILFGQNASLDVKGSFVGTTADSVVFGDGFEFSASNPTTPPLLTINIPNGLKFRDNPEDIAVNQSVLEVNPGKTLALVGGKIDIEGGEEGVLRASEGRVELGGLTGAGEIKIAGEQTPSEFRFDSLSFPEGVARGNVSLNNLALVDVAGSGGGSITINAKNLEIAGDSRLDAGIAEDLGSTEAKAGDILINATDNVNLDGIRIENDVNRNATGNSGNVNISTKSFSMSNGAQISASTSGKGNAGNVTITADDAVKLSNTASIFSTVTAGAEGNGGKIDITAKSLSLDSGAQLQTALGKKDGSVAGSKGNAGEINLNIADTVTITGQALQDDGLVVSGLRSDILKGAEGKGGDINIKARNLFLADLAQISASTSGIGNAGKVIPI